MDIQNFYRKATAEEIKFYKSALFPRERRIVSPYSYQVLKKRMQRSPLPERLALEKLLSDFPVGKVETSR